MNNTASNSSIIWRLIITALVVAWAVSSMMPFTDTPFEDFIKNRATANQTEFAEFVKKCESRVDNANYRTDKTKSPTLYIAMRDLANAEERDLSKFFPDINVADIPNVKKRNDVLLKELYRQSKGAIKRGLDLQGGVSFTLQIDDKNLDKEETARSGQLKDVLTVMNNRVNGLGITEPTIRIVGSNSIEVQMPGVSLKDNPEAIEELSRPAKLEFRLVHRTAQPSSLKPPASEIPSGYELLVQEEEVRGKTVEVPRYVKRRPEANGSIIKRAYPTIDDTGRFSIAMEFTGDGAKVFEKITRQILDEDRKTGVKQPLAIVLDGKLMSAPNIQSVISDRGSITGNFTRREAIELSNALNNPLAVGLKRTSLNEVGPSLAADATESSLMAVGIGAGLTVLFMIVVYALMGGVAVVSVLLNIVMIVGVLASFGATMTLPGIAALVLTMGMAVDSNILVFERMREELRLGKSLWSSLEAGYERAFSTIVDANLTTLISAVILWQFGSGAVKGFGVTLAIGIFTTLFCCLVFSRAVLEFGVKYNVIKRALMLSFMKQDCKINFMKYAKASFAVSWAIVLIGICVVCYRGDKTLSIDFTGGDIVTVGFNPEHKISVGDITALSEITSDTGVGEIQASYQTDISSKTEKLVLQVESEKGQRVFDMLSQKFPKAELKLIAQQSVGASVSGEITRDAFIATALALLGMLVYIAFRFELSYGIGAVVATFHDVMMTIGAYVIFGMLGIGSGQFSSPMVAAILMVMGYTINDKIVVFDRIREELVLRPTMSLYEVINYSINRTLSRTLLTSISTFVVAFALFFFGTGIIVDFSLVFMLGILVGTFSSIFIASPIFYYVNHGVRTKLDNKAPAKVHSWEE